VATLAIAMATKMGYGENALKDLALGCLIHDIGMLRIPKRIYQAKRRLSPREIAEITNHPVRTAETLGTHLLSLSLSTIAVAYQIHERSNGTGYPRGRTASQIHQLAKIAGVADTFAGLAACRPHRDGLQPYFIMKKLLQGVAEGLFEADVLRGLLRTISLFPVGSFVRLSDGRQARVIRANDDSYDRPVVELATSGPPQGNANVVDLLQESKLKIVQTIPDLG
jgi:HD-GYP domain-containing protein (c-di-GMP phosphodiesterase class II)